MTGVLGTLRDADALSALDVELARGLGNLLGDAREEVLLAVALASRATRDGHVCADLKRLAASEIRDENGVTVLAGCPPLASWRALLVSSPLVGTGETVTPLVLTPDDRLYLRRHWDDEQRLAEALRERSRRFVEPSDPSALRALVRGLFGPVTKGEPDWQRIAAELATVSFLTVVSGGPGTGKTSTVTKILALAIADALASGIARPRALLLAPTGKAAARLAEAVARAKTALECPDVVRDLIPTEARTVHRALQVDREGHFRIDRERPLFANVVVVDEASMIDVALMRRLVEAVPGTARLVLLGDHHQLSSVEAGAVLSDVCGDPRVARYSPALALRVKRVYEEPLPPETVGVGAPGIDDSIVTLRKSFRFDEASHLGALSAAIQAGDPDTVLGLLRAGSDDLAFLEPRGEGLEARLFALATEGFRAFATSTAPDEALDRLATFRVLCAHRHGPLGVEETNAAIGRALRDAGWLVKNGVVHPVMIHRNDPALDLFNGDVGVLFRTDSAVRAVFRSGDGKLRALSPARLPPHEPAFAMSVHKSQGSEFDDVIVVLPKAGSPLLSRELLYTGVTRARLRVVVHGTAEAVREAVLKPAARASGLSAALRAVNAD